MDRSLGTLIRTSLTDPQAVARELMAMNLGRDALWTGLGLIAVINTFLILLVLQIAPPTADAPSRTCKIVNSFVDALFSATAPKPIDMPVSTA